MTSYFFEPEEKKVIQEFLDKGYVTFPLPDRVLLDQIKEIIFHCGSEILGRDKDKETFFNETHRLLSAEGLNDFRVSLINKLNSQENLRPMIYQLGKKYVDWIAGNEISMQRSINLSIQFPQDASSLLPLHTDVWSGNSPFELVFWLPFVDVYRTKSMYILPLPESKKIFQEFGKYQDLTAEELYQQIKGKLDWFDLPYGHAAIFSHSLLHGNRINEERETRWTFNMRFKSLLSPCGAKEMGESFLPITIRPLTRIGCEYLPPGPL